MNYLISFGLLWICYVVIIVSYRVYFHPLSSFPGPKLAAGSFWYQIWYDVFLWGKYTKKIQSLHRQYGPIIRISPDELHCNDPDFLDTLYTYGRQKRDKPPHNVWGWPMALRSSTFATSDHDLHHRRRAPLSKFFSRAQVAKHEELVQKRAQILCDRLLENRGGGAFTPKTTYFCFSTDVARDYCFGFNPGERPDWDSSIEDAGSMVLKMTHLARYLPGLMNLMDWIPSCLVRAFSSKAGALMKHIKCTIPNYVARARSIYDRGSENNETLITAVLKSELPPAEKTTGRLIAESNVVILAAGDVIATLLSIITYHVLSNADILERLQRELSAAVSAGSEVPAWSALESLPYLSAVIHEGLRLMYGASGRIALIPSHQDLQYAGVRHQPGSFTGVQYKIPRGFAVGMSAYLTHMDERIFPAPEQFLPERWLDMNGQKNLELKRYLCTFSRGARQCLGMQLAYCEGYVAVAALVLRVLPLMRLYQTTIADIEYDHDEVIGMHKSNSKGLRVVIESGDGYSL